MSPTQMPPHSSGETAYAALMGAIQEGRVRPGDRLREETLAELLGLSRTPVREALRRLEAEGIVEHRPRLGAVLRSLDHTEMVELYEMRIVLERTAAELAAQHGTEAEFDTLEALNAEFEAERANGARAAAINHAFHQGLYAAARNRFLQQSARGLNNALLLLGTTTFHDTARVDVVLRQHADLVAGLRARDPAKAAQAAEAHLQTSLRYRLKALSL